MTHFCFSPVLFEPLSYEGLSLGKGCGKMLQGVYLCEKLKDEFRVNITVHHSLLNVEVFRMDRLTTLPQSGCSFY